jgi:hypothetical protein
MEKKPPPKWVKSYAKEVCDFLKLPYDRLTIEMVAKPGGISSWDGAFWFYGGTDTGKIHLHKRFTPRKTVRGKKVIIHELIHYKMQQIDVVVRYDLISKLNSTYDKRKTSEDYVEVIEDYVNEMTEIIYNVMENKNAFKNP